MSQRGEREQVGDEENRPVGFFWELMALIGVLIAEVADMLDESFRPLRARFRRWLTVDDRDHQMR